jgi:hypothetical protein
MGDIDLLVRHDFNTYVTVRNHNVAVVCSCGWRSAAWSRAGLAGAEWDLHRAFV